MGSRSAEWLLVNGIDGDVVSQRLSHVRIVGALLAAGIALGFIAVGAVLVLASVSAGLVSVAIGAVSLVVGPFAGWRWARHAVESDRGEWANRALSTVIAGSVAVSLMWPSVGLAVQLASGVDAVVAVASAAYLALILIALCAVFSFTVGVPLGLLWIWLLRHLEGRRRY
jgi:hypothetical protein